MVVMLSLGAALLAGTSDFLGGLASRRAAALVVTAASQLFSMVAAFVLALIVGGDVVARDLWLGALGGVGAALGLLSLYAGYSVARVSVAAPVAGVGAAALPVLFDLATGGDLVMRAGAGITLGLVAIALISLERSDSTASVGVSLRYGFGGAIGLGALLLCLSRTSDDGGLWAVVPSRVTGGLVMLIVLAITRTNFRLPRVALAPVLGIAVFGACANSMFVVATQIGSVSTAAVLTSMFPAATVMWARLIFGERLRRVQVLGLGFALVAVGLIASV
ncbi:MAG: DMT family transporter [Actinomycetia bacterium]|nr:DMT family transporter [Actinomycetes bacterium]